MHDELRETGGAAPFTTTVSEMCRMLSIGTSTGWALIGGEEPEIESITIGRRRLPVIASIQDYVARRRSAPRHKVARPPPGEGRKHHRANRVTSPKT
jgi:hypothetical protein